jgi:hypothetical protein
MRTTAALERLGFGRGPFTRMDLQSGYRSQAAGP